MRIVGLIAIAGVGIGLTACEPSGGAREEASARPGVQVSGVPGDQSVTVTNESGERVNIRTGGASVSADAPAFVQPYPGAELTSSVTSPDTSGQMVSFNTNADPDTVIAFYRERAEEAGLSSNASMTMGETRMYGAEAPDGGALSVMVVPAEGRSNVTITWAARG